MGKKERTWILRVANSTPMVDLDSKLNSFLVNLASRLDLPTPESPIKTTAKKQVGITKPGCESKINKGIWPLKKLKTKKENWFW